MLPLPRLPAVAALDSALFIGTNWTDLTDGGATTLHKHDHGGQDGLSDDDHAGYFRSAGRSGGQSGIGGLDAGDDLTLSSTVHATKGNIHLGALSTFDEVNTRLGIGTLSPPAAVTAVTDGVTTVLEAYTYNNNAVGCGLRAYRARGSKAAPRRIKSGDQVGIYNAKSAYAADDATDAVFPSGAQCAFAFYATEDQTSTAGGHDWALLLAPIGAVTQVEKLRVTGYGHVIIPEATVNPGTANLAADAALAWYTKADKLVFAYNNGGTMTYITLDLDGSDVTWAHSTSAP